MVFKKNQIKTKEFRNFVRHAILVSMREEYENHFNKYGYYPLYIMICLVWLGTYVNYDNNKDKYGAKAFPYRRIIKCCETDNESLDLEPYIDEIVEYADESLYSKKFKDEFEFLGDYENKGPVTYTDSIEYMKEVKNKMIIEEDEYNNRSNKECN